MGDELDLWPDSGDDEGLGDETARFHLARARELLARGGRPHVARPCRWCGSTDGILLEKSGQNTVYCTGCWRHSYNAPKTETGQKPRTVSTVREQIKPSQQARIFDRDQGRCILCGTREMLTIGHLLSIHEAHELGFAGPELHDDANLAAMCEACNLGLGRRSVSPRTYAVLMHRLVLAEMARAGAPPADAEHDSVVTD
ncbi:MAG: hypothetical protein M3203_01650 [Actinomycetota bacterium]|nr:hypothetical protein [Actinomycetota bacterium]